VQIGILIIKIDMIRVRIKQTSGTNANYTKPPMSFLHKINGDTTKKISATDKIIKADEQL
jgi:hypothetical protein